MGTGLGEQTREHHDVEVVVRRCDQQQVYAGLSGESDLLALDPPEGTWRPWDGVPISAPAFQLQARSSSRQFDIFTEDIDDKHWHLRRDHRISKAAEDVVVLTASGIPVVRCEIQLLYMAKSTEPKNAHDFANARPHLSDEAAAWLAHALQITLPEHWWLGERESRRLLIDVSRHGPTSATGLPSCATTKAHPSTCVRQTLMAARRTRAGIVVRGLDPLDGYRSTLWS